MDATRKDDHKICLHLVHGVPACTDIIVRFTFPPIYAGIMLYAQPIMLCQHNQSRFIQ